MVGYGVQDFLYALVSKKIGFFKTSIWAFAFAFLIYIPLTFFLFTYHPLSILDIALIIAAGVATGIGMLSFLKGFQIGNVSIVATVGNTWGAVTAVLGFLILGETITNFQILDIILIVIGTAVISLNLRDLMKADRKKLHVGLGYAFMATFAFGIWAFAAAFLTMTLGWFTTAFLILIPIVIFILLYGFLTKQEMKVSKNHLPLLFFISLFVVFVGLAYNLGVTYNYADIVAPISSASPLVTIVLAVLLLKERLSLHQKIGVALVLIGLVALSI